MRLDLTPAADNRLGISAGSDAAILQAISNADFLEHWHRNGYLHLPGLMKDAPLDDLWRDVEQAWQDRPNVDMCMGVNGVSATSMDKVCGRPDKLYRLFNFHQFSPACLQLALWPSIVELVRVLLRGDPVLMQTLTYEYSSEQSMHVDYIPVRTKIPHLMMASWIACEDVDETTGPLVYYPGSHNIDPMGISERDYGEFFQADTPLDVNSFMARECARMGLRRTELHAKRGDVFLWHAALIHGGSKVLDYGRTRKSLVCHYSTLEAYPACNFYKHATPAKVGDGTYYKVWA